MRGTDVDARHSGRLEAPGGAIFAFDAQGIPGEHDDKREERRRGDGEGRRLQKIFRIEIHAPRFIYSF